MRALGLCVTAWLGLLAVGCSGDAEHRILGQFFAASRLRDLTAVSEVATVVFEPRSNGTVLDFAVEHVGAEQRSGERLRKNVTVSARVRLPSGEILQKTLIVTMEQTLAGNWMVTAFKD
jgi:hypothetical protein